ncbi:MAG: hypothetical protein ACYT04_95260, partial [Nostoc sp.]
SIKGDRTPDKRDRFDLLFSHLIENYLKFATPLAENANVSIGIASGAKSIKADILAIGQTLKNCPRTKPVTVSHSFNSQNSLKSKKTPAPANNSPRW